MNTYHINRGIGEGRVMGFFDTDTNDTSDIINYFANRCHRAGEVCENKRHHASVRLSCYVLTRFELYGCNTEYNKIHREQPCRFERHRETPKNASLYASLQLKKKEK
ncbi:hypothetical protein CEXT_715691 [Caerostris extrusa]|uniref:Uncharacterized protein n=1 Tax=Caerostris extrusa TaxID=172846 RepID=A0AAV4MLP1_CAEEX|nr:hypothetical protein CEXT_715691 [Caerostris extrusa]